MPTESTDPFADVEFAPIYTPGALPTEPEPEPEPEPDEHTCCECGETVSADETITHGSRDYCESCESDNFDPCDRCEESIPVDDLYAINTGRRDSAQWCEDCRDSHSWNCQDCGETFSDRISYETYCDEPLCQSCYENNYFYCEGCESVCHQDDYGSDCRCTQCSEEEEDSRGPIRDYSTDADSCLGFLGKPKDKIFYGLELEAEANPSDCRGEKAQECIDLLGDDFVICKEDGSLGAGGFEIVTAPASLEIQRERWLEFLDNVPNRLRSWESGKCGMHIHVSRRPLSQLTIGKILEFVNSPANSAFIVRVAGRELCHWCKATDKKVSSVCKYDGDRYQAVNLTNSATIEFRIFRGTLKKTSFMRNLEFVAATIQFARQAGMRELTSSAFFTFVNSRRKDYPFLADWLVTRGYLRAFRKPIPSHISVA